MIRSLKLLESLSVYIFLFLIFNNFIVIEYKETDTVISTVELIELFMKLEQNFEDVDGDSQKVYFNYFKLFEKYNSDYLSFETLKDDYNIGKRDLQIFFECDQYFSSNGYAEYFMNRLIKDNSVQSFTDIDIRSKIELKVLKNSDMKEICLMNGEVTIMKFAVFYGFRNIQNILKNLKNKKKESEYSYIEVMACPGGCLNGGNINKALFCFVLYC